MFNLNQAIAEWRRRMGAEGIKSTAALNELEDHLRGEIERQIRSGAGEEQAFQAAAAGLGRADALKLEFAKVARGRPWRWFLHVFYFFSVAYLLAINFWTLLEYELSPWARIFAASVVSLTCLGLAFLPRLLKSLPAVTYERLARAIKTGTSLVWLWTIWLLLGVGHIVNVEIGIVPTMMLWLLSAAVALAVLAYGLDGRPLPRGDSGGAPPAFQPRPQTIPPTPPCPPDFAKELSPSKPIDPIVYQSLEAAFGEAFRLGHDYIGTEHVLLGILKLAKGSFAAVLQRLNLDCEAVRIEVERLVFPISNHPANAAIPFTPRAWRAVQLAAREANNLGHSQVRAEHIFVGLLLEGSGVAAKALKNLGFRLKETRQEVMSELCAHRGGTM